MRSRRRNPAIPGTPMGMAPVAYGLWQKQLDFDPADPLWPNRDRFILSAGHASMLLYALLHLTKTQAVTADYEPLHRPSVTLDDIKALPAARQCLPRPSGIPSDLRRRGDHRAARPRCRDERWPRDRRAMARAHFNRPDYPVVDWRIWALCGDGCMMEGISNEAASLAGHLRLNKLCWIYDSNRVSIEGHTEIAFTEDVATRFLGLGWNVLHVRDANDEQEVLARVRSCQTGARPAEPDHHRKPHRLRRAAQAGLRRRRMASRWASRRSRLPSDSTAGPRMRSSWCPTASTQHFADGIGARGAAKHAEWRDLFQRYRVGASRSRAGLRGDAAARAAFRLGGSAFRPFRPIPRASPAAIASGPGRERDRPENPLADRRCSGSRAVHQDADDVRGRRRFSAGKSLSAATFISASASTRWARRSTAWRSRSCGRSAPAS